MCKLKKTNGKSPNPRIDECMRIFIKNLSLVLDVNHKIVGCCCGHNKYPMTIILERKDLGHVEYFDLISGETIPRLSRFYKKDKQGYYYIPEVSKCKP